MKKIIILFLCIILSLMFCACGGMTDEEIKEVRDISFEGTELTVVLGTNKSTGFEWDFEIYGDCIEQSVNKSFKVTGKQGDATGEVSIGFCGLKAGDAVIVFATPNGWDGTGEGDAYTVNVSVSEDGTILNASGENGNTYVPVESEEDKLFSAPYVEMLMSGDYQYTYSLTYDEKDYKAIIASKNGMVSRSAISDDGTYSSRVVTINGNAWQVNDLTGEVYDLGAESAETLPDFSKLTFNAAKTLDTGAIAEAYDFEYQDNPCNMVFVFDSDGLFVEIIMTVGETTSEMPIIEMKSPSESMLFDTPKD